MTHYKKPLFKVIAYDKSALPAFEYCCFSRALSWLKKDLQPLTRTNLQEIQKKYNHHCINNRQEPLQLPHLNLQIHFQPINTLPKTNHYLINTVQTGNKNNHVIGVKNNTQTNIATIFSAIESNDITNSGPYRDFLINLNKQKLPFQVMSFITP